MTGLSGSAKGVNQMRQISVLIADDHQLLRETLVMFLGRNEDFRIISAGTLPEALERIRTDGPFDVLLLDVVMPGMNGLRGVQIALDAMGEGHVMLMSGNVQREFVEDAVELGVKGFVPKTLSPDTLAEAVRLVVAGRTYLPVEHYAELMPPLPPGIAQLSPQETRVLRYLCQGMANKEIAREMDLTEITIKTHMRAVCTKLNARNRTHAALIGTTHFRS